MATGKLFRYFKMVPEMESAQRGNDTSLCRTRHFIDSYWECLKGKTQCPYATRYDRACFCTHPKRCGFERNKVRSESH